MDVGICVLLIRGKNRNINVPLKEGLTDDMFQPLFQKIVSKAYEKFKPDVVLLINGADNLNGDPLGSWNLSISSFQFLSSFVRNVLKPEITIILGGGKELIRFKNPNDCHDINSYMIRRVQLHQHR